MSATVKTTGAPKINGDWQHRGWHPQAMCPSHTHMPHTVLKIKYIVQSTFNAALLSLNVRQGYL